MGDVIPMLDKMAPILGPDVTNIFRLMSLAEEEIAAAIERDPLNELEINDAFCLMCPRMVLFGGRTPELYRHHIRELIARHVAGEDTRPGTKAEVLATLSHTSLISNLIPAAHVLMEQLIDEILPEVHSEGYAWSKENSGWHAQEEYPGSVEATLADLRRECFDDQRTRDQKRRTS
jgi:hypothetical protein